MTFEVTFKVKDTWTMFSSSLYKRAEVSAAVAV